MTDKQQPNLFSALFQFRPRENFTSSENFLTESLVYVLKTHEPACKAWLRLILPDESEFYGVNIQTRATDRDSESGSTIYPDVRVDCKTADGKDIRVRLEHKWGSPCVLEQLKNYARLFVKEDMLGHLLFVCANYDQLKSAKEFPSHEFYGKVIFKAILWENVYECLSAVQENNRSLQELLEFMNGHGLSPGEPISRDSARAFIERSEFIKSFKNQLKRFMEKLLHEHEDDWNFLPKRYRVKPQVEDRYGRVAIEFVSAEWAPGITVGFLYDSYDHGEFSKREQGIDLMLRIEADPKKNPNPDEVVGALKKKRSSLLNLGAIVRLKGDEGHDNKHTLLLVQRCLADVIGTSDKEQDQLKLIFEQLKVWGEALFKDGELEPVLEKLKR